MKRLRNDHLGAEFLFPWRDPAHAPPPLQLVASTLAGVTDSFGNLVKAVGHLPPKTQGPRFLTREGVRAHGSPGTR